MKTFALSDAVAAIPDGASLMIGGVMGVGTPEDLVDELCGQQRRDLTVIANDTARPGIGIRKLISARLVRKALVSHIGTNPETQQQMLAGELAVELVVPPHGSVMQIPDCDCEGSGKNRHYLRFREPRFLRRTSSR